MTRTYLVTGAAGGIGRVTVELLRSRGHRVIGADLHSADIDADLATDRGRADLVARAADLSGGTIVKQALARWIRRSAPSEDWAGSGIPLNAVAPGVVATPMTAALTGDEAARAALLERVPMPLGGVIEPRPIAELLAWLTGEENAHCCGQVVFIDGGADAVLRGDRTW